MRLHRPIRTWLWATAPSLGVNAGLDGRRMQSFPGCAFVTIRPRRPREVIGRTSYLGRERGSRWTPHGTDEPPDRLREQVVLHREEGGGDAGRDADLVVDVFEVVAHGAFADDERFRHL